MSDRVPSSPPEDLGPDRLAGPAALLRDLDLRPDKRLSQSFLCEPAVARAMVHAALLSPDTSVLEIGPGLGMVTREIVRAAGSVVAVEVDRDLAGALHAALGTPPNLTVVEADALSVDLKQHVAEPFVAVASLPYHIATALLFRLLFVRPRPHRSVVMVQEEVARRLVANSAPANYLGIAVATVAEATIVRRVSPGCFFPMPKVRSALVRLDLLARPRMELDVAAPFLSFLRAGFAQPRKQLHNSLAQGLAVPTADVLAVLERASLDPRSRPGDLNVGDWVALHEIWTSRRHVH